MPDAITRARTFAAAHAKLVAMGASREALAEYRRRETRADPALFGLVYLSRHLTDEAGVLSLSTVHEDWAASALTWIDRGAAPQSDRRAEVAPRSMGKSTWWFLILPMWGAAHGHRRFAAAFADTDTQAQTHLATFKAELDANALLREDYPDLVQPKTRGRGSVMADRVSLYHAASGFVFAAAGMDSSNLGMKVGDRRPDLLILDDIEPHEGRYSPDLATKRLNTLRQAILPLNIYAAVILVGTVTMQGSIVHQIVKRSRGDYDDGDGTEWVDEESIRAHHVMPIVTDDAGERHSIWPEKWSLAYLDSIAHTRQFALNYLNDPLGAEGDYWQIEDFRRLPYTEALAAAITHEVISVDPAVTTTEKSDATAISAVGWADPRLAPAEHAKKCAVLEAKAIRKGGDEIRLEVLRFVARAVARGHAVLVIVETNQGGDLWKRVFHDMPVRVKTYSSTAPKHVRAADALDHYQRGRVAHAPGLRDAEGELVAFPKAPHDDYVDSIGAGVRYFLSRDKKRGVTVGAETASYA